MFGGLARLLAAFGKSGVDVYEWDQSDVRKKRLPKGPVWTNLTTPHQKLNFTGWQLAHAVVKADYLIERALLLPGLGLLLQLDHIVDFASASNLKLVPGAVDTLNDFTRTSLSGRIGQGLSLLFAQSKGYAFVCHLASDPIVVSHIATLPKKSKKVADFLFEDSGNQRMILESKASFKQSMDAPSPIKSTLKAALTEQIDYWMTRISPAASKGYAVYSCLRESGNPVPTALIFVDPPKQRIRQPIEFPRGHVRRRNYAAWLRLMGLTETADNLSRTNTHERLQTILPVIRVGTRRFGVVVQYSLEKPGRWLAIGLDVEALKAIGSSLNDDDGPLLAYNEAPAGDQFGSIFADGSYLGLIDERSQFEGYQPFLL